MSGFSCLAAVAVAVAVAVVVVLLPFYRLPRENLPSPYLRCLLTPLSLSLLFYPKENHHAGPFIEHCRLYVKPSRLSPQEHDPARIGYGRGTYLGSVVPRREFTPAVQYACLPSTIRL